MLPLKKLSVFFFLSALCYGVLMAPWPGLMDAYRTAFRTCGSWLFGSFGSRGSVQFEPLSSADHSLDTTLVLRKGRLRGSMDINSGYVGYRPTAFLIALVLATPVRWPRRLAALLAGLVLVDVFIAFRLWLSIFNAYSDDNLLALYSLSPFWKSALRGTVLVLFRAPAGHYVVPMFIWMLVTFRRGDLSGVLALSDHRSTPRAPR